MTKARREADDADAVEEQAEPASASTPAVPVPLAEAALVEAQAAVAAAGSDPSTRMQYALLLGVLSVRESLEGLRGDVDYVGGEVANLGVALDWPRRPS